MYLLQSRLTQIATMHQIHTDTDGRPPEVRLRTKTMLWMLGSYTQVKELQTKRNLHSLL